MAAWRKCRPVKITRVIETAGEAEMTETKHARPYVGQPLRGREDRRLLTGKGRYVDDIRLTGMLHRQTGQLLTGSLLDYAVPRADVLPAIRSHFQETPSPTNPLGVKGIGESGTIGAPPTIVHAVLDALAPLGIAHLDMPLKPSKIWAAIQAARADATQ